MSFRNVKVYPNAAVNAVSATAITAAIVFAIVVICLSGCSVVNQGLLESSQAFYDAVAPEYGAYVENDNRLDEDERENRKRTIRSQGFSLRKHQELLKEQGAPE